jgi:DNA-binding MarR family transcriptional regulator
MQDASEITKQTVQLIHDQCLCLAAQRAARRLARRFDRIFAPLGLTNGQFSLMVALQGMTAPRLGRVAALLAMDQTTVTAAVKALERRGLVAQVADAADQRVRLVSLTAAGKALLVQAVPLWIAEHDQLARELPPGQAALLAGMLTGIGAPAAG